MISNCFDGKTVQDGRRKSEIESREIHHSLPYSLRKLLPDINSDDEANDVDGIKILKRELELVSKILLTDGDGYDCSRNLKRTSTK